MFKSGDPSAVGAEKKKKLLEAQSAVKVKHQENAPTKKTPMINTDVSYQTTDGLC